MRKLLVLFAILAFAGLVATVHAEQLQYTATGITINGNDSEWTGGKYTNDNVLDSGTGAYAAADWQYIRMGDDATSLYAFVHYYDNGSATINPAGSPNRSEPNTATIYFDTDKSAATGSTYDANNAYAFPAGFGADYKISSVFYRSSSYYLTISAWNGSAWASQGTLAWSNGGTSNCAYYVNEGSTISGGYTTMIEFKVNLSSLGLTASPTFNWIADTNKNSLGYRDVYPDTSFNTYGVPEPSTFALLAAGLAGLLCYAWRKR